MLSFSGKELNETQEEPVELKITFLFPSRMPVSAVKHFLASEIDTKSCSHSGAVYSE